MPLIFNFFSLVLVQNTLKDKPGGIQQQYLINQTQYTDLCFLLSSLMDKLCSPSQASSSIFKSLLEQWYLGLCDKTS